MPYTTAIHSNGSCMHGEPNKTIEDLIRVLTCGLYFLDPVYESPGHDFVADHRDEEGRGECHIFGNFRNLSHVFNISSNDQEIIEKLSVAIQTNKVFPGYQNIKRAREERIAQSEGVS